MGAVKDSPLIRPRPSSLDDQSPEDAPVADVRQADHEGPSGLECFDGSIEDSPRLNEVLEDIRGHDAVEPAQGHQHVAPVRQVIQVEAMDIVQLLPAHLPRTPAHARLPRRSELPAPA